IWVPDLRRINYDNKRIIVSKKRTRNLFDLTSLWKKTVLVNMDEQAAEDLGSDMDLSTPPPPNPLAIMNPIVLNPQLNESDDEDAIVLHRGSPQAPNAWRFGGW
ncbi:hypothetical protein BKA62DRAFT_629957, partial [Auriculariales sp. MPI-PUGE-AT-0066]